MVKFEDKEAKFYMVWDLEFNKPATFDIYRTIGAAKNGCNAFYRYNDTGPRTKYVVTEIQIPISGKKWFKDNDEWKELEGMDKFLYG